jgi:hypothetical protein
MVCHELKHRTVGPRDGRAHLPPQRHTGGRYSALGRSALVLAAAMLEAGVMNEGGEWVEDKDVRLGMEAYRERLTRPE